MATPAILEPELFDRAQTRLRRNKELASRNVKRDYLLRGYIYCRRCGQRYQGKTHHYRTKEGLREYRYYRCSGPFRINVPHCLNRSREAETLESTVWREIELVLSNPSVILAGLEMLQAEAKMGDTCLAALATVENRLSELDRQQEQLLRWALKGFPESTVEAEVKRLNQDREHLATRKAEIEQRIELARQAQINADSVIQGIY